MLFVVVGAYEIPNNVSYSCTLYEYILGTSTTRRDFIPQLIPLIKIPRMHLLNIVSTCTPYSSRNSCFIQLLSGSGYSRSRVVAFAQLRYVGTVQVRVLITTPPRMYLTIARQVETSSSHTKLYFTFTRSYRVFDGIPCAELGKLTLFPPFGPLRRPLNNRGVSLSILIQLLHRPRHFAFQAPRPPSFQLVYIKG